MLRSLYGIVKEAEEQRITVEVGGFFLSLSVPQEREFILEKQMHIHTHLHWNQEQGPTLFGFIAESDRAVFLLIMSCSGIGPKIALAILAQLGSRQFIEAVQTGNEQALSKVSGIGQKKAEQIIVQLKHKVAKLIKSGVAGESSENMAHWHNVSEVLTSLNYTRQEITQTMKYLGDTYAGQSVPFDQLMRQALSFLSKRA